MYLHVVDTGYIHITQWTSKHCHILSTFPCLYCVLASGILHAHVNIHGQISNVYTCTCTWIMHQVSLLFENSIVQYLACKRWINFRFVTGLDVRNTKSCVMYMYVYIMSKTRTFDNGLVMISLPDNTDYSYEDYRAFNIF
jgi:hypothetical protein